ncbi:MAG: hypothetical protein II767_13005 [Proteobacteria bacterium]|nr:hypothetical protein [Pseudomonadota bacterium]
MDFFAKKDSDPNKVTSKNAFEKANAGAAKSPNTNVTAAYVQIHTNTQASHTWLTIKSAKDIAIDQSPWVSQSQKAASGPSAKHMENHFETTLGFNKVGKDTGKVIEPDFKHAPEISKEYALSEAQYKAMYLYINSKREHKWSNLGYNSTTFATHALKAAGLSISSFSSTGGLAKQFKKDAKQSEKAQGARESANETSAKLWNSPSKSSLHKAQKASAIANAYQKPEGSVSYSYDSSTLRLREKASKYEDLNNEIESATKGNAISALRSLIQAREFAKWNDIKPYADKLMHNNIISVIQYQAIQELYSMMATRGSYLPSMGIIGPNMGKGVFSEVGVNEFLDTIEILTAISNGNLTDLIPMNELEGAAKKIANDITHKNVKLSPSESVRLTLVLVNGMNNYPEFVTALKKYIQEAYSKFSSDEYIEKHDAAALKVLLERKQPQREHDRDRNFDPTKAYEYSGQSTGSQKPALLAPAKERIKATLDALQ